MVVQSLVFCNEPAFPRCALIRCSQEATSADRAARKRPFGMVVGVQEAGLHPRRAKTAEKRAARPRQGSARAQPKRNIKNFSLLISIYIYLQY